MSTYAELALPILKVWNKDSKKAMDMLAADPYSPVAQALFTLYHQRGHALCWRFAKVAAEYNIHLAILFYCLMGHRCFDKGDLHGMRKAYDQVEALALGRIDASQKWLFSAYFYGVRHERAMDRKLEYARKAIVNVRYSWAMSSSIIETKIIRLFLWVRLHAPELAQDYQVLIDKIVHKGMFSAKRWEELKAESAERSRERFTEECPCDSKAPAVGNP